MLQFIGFRLENEEYAVPIVSVREIINLQQITTLPNVPEYVEGMTSIRGNVVPIINLKKRMHLPGNGNGSSMKIMVIASEKNTYGVLIDGVTGVLSIEEQAIEASETIADSGTASFVDGIAKLGNRLVIILDTVSLLPVRAHPAPEISATKE